MSARDIPYLERVKAIRKTSLDKAELDRWFGKYRYSVNNAKSREINHELTFHQYLRLAEKAGLHCPGQVGKTVGSFQLGRLGDVGPYSYRNCRFITVTQNRIEANINGRYDESNRKKREIYNPKIAEGARRRYAEGGKELRDRIGDQHRLVSLIVDPNGKIHIVDRFKKFARDHELNIGNLRDALKGKRPDYKGWSGFYLGPLG